MAKGQIDIIVAKQAIVEVDKGVKAVSMLNDKIIETSKSARELNTSLSSIKTSNDLDAQLKKNVDSQKKVAEAVEKTRLAEVKLAKDREAAFDKFERAQQSANRARVKESEAITRNKLALDKQRKSMVETSRAYKKLSQDSVKARKNAQDLGATFGTTSKQFKIAAAEANRLNNKLKQIDAATGVYGRSVGNYGSALKGAIGFTKQMVSALGLMGGAFLAVQIIKNAAKTIKEFNKETAVLASVLQKSRKEIKPLIKSAKELGATTAKTANEVVKLQVSYARLGFEMAEIVQLTEATIMGSIAMNSELDETANLVGAIVNSMDELNTTDAPAIIDAMSLATAKSALNFEKLSNGLPIVLGAANALNVPFTKVVATLGKLADAGIETSTAATSLRNIFIESARLGIDYEEALQKITLSQDKLTTANEIFGKRAAVSALIVAQSAEGVRELDTALQGAIGTAEKMATVQLDTLTGEITLANSAWDGFILSVEDGEGSISKAVRSAVGSFTQLFNSLTEINEATEAIGPELINDGGWLDLVGLGFIKVASNMGKATGSLKILNQELKDLRGSDVTVQDLSDAYIFYEKVLLDTDASDKIHTATLEFMLTKIEELVMAKKAQIKTDQDLEDKLFEQKEVLIDLLLVIDESLELKELDKKTTKELTAMLNRYNEELKRQEDILDGSIESLKEMIKANSEIIEQTNDKSLRRKLQGENLLLAKQLKLMQAIPKAVKAIKAVSVGVVTQEGLAEREASKVDRGTALAGGGTADFPDSAEDLPGQDPFNFDVGGASAFETAVDDVGIFVDEYGSLLGQATDITNAFFDNRLARIQEDIDASNAFFDEQIAAAEGNQAQQERLEQEKAKKEAELRKKGQKEQIKAAIFQRSVAALSIILNTATAVIGALAPPPTGLGPIAGIPLAVGVGVLGAAQLALTLAAPLPKFKDGTKAPLSRDTMAITGDGGKHEPITLGGQLIGVSPSTSTLTMLPKGAEVHKDFESLASSSNYDLEAINRAAVMTSLYSDSAKLNAVQSANLFDIALDKYHGGIQKEIKQGLKKFSSNTSITINTEHLRFENDTL
jgi:hypothetical protein